MNGSTASGIHAMYGMCTHAHTHTRTRAHAHTRAHNKHAHAHTNAFSCRSNAIGLAHHPVHLPPRRTLHRPTHLDIFFHFIKKSAERKAPTNHPTKPRFETVSRRRCRVVELSSRRGRVGWILHDRIHCRVDRSRSGPPSRSPRALRCGLADDASASVKHCTARRPARVGSCWVVSVVALLVGCLHLLHRLTGARCLEKSFPRTSCTELGAPVRHRATSRRQHHPLQYALQSRHRGIISRGSMRHRNDMSGGV